MLIRISANDPRFKPVTFKKGLNIIIAEKTDTSSKKDTRNGVGKTTLLNIIDFCLGANFTRSPLPKEALSDWVFTLELELQGQKIIVERSIASPRQINIQGDVSHFTPKPNCDENGILSYSVEDWLVLLGGKLFGLDVNSNNNNSILDHAIKTEITKPNSNLSFRNLFSYFLRIGSGAYLDPFKPFPNQNAINMQKCTAFLMGLNWQIVDETKGIKDQEGDIKALTKALKSKFSLTKGRLEAERLKYESELNRDRNALSNFKVHPQYREIQDNADELHQKINTQRNLNEINRLKLTSYDAATQDEITSTQVTIEALYEEAGLVFGEAIKKRLTDARNFHDQLLTNRKHFLQTEKKALSDQIGAGEKALADMIDKRAAFLSILKTNGSLEEYTKLNEYHAKKQSELEIIKRDIERFDNLEKNKREITAKKSELSLKFERDYETARPQWENHIQLFNENSKKLYNKAADLIINYSENGYKFEIEIPKKGSDGVGKMETYLYDMMMVETFAKKRLINFLIHDSTVFEGVDGRQGALALELANSKGQELGFQYICTINQDNILSFEFSDGFKFDDYVRLRLSDKEPKNSLLGFSFTSEQAQNLHPKITP